MIVLFLGHAYMKSNHVGSGDRPAFLHFLFQMKQTLWCTRKTL